MLIELTVSYLFFRGVCACACACMFYLQKEKAGPEREGVFPMVSGRSVAEPWDRGGEGGNMVKGTGEERKMGRRKRREKRAGS